MHDVLEEITDIHLFIRESEMGAKLEGHVFPSMARIKSNPEIYRLAETIYQQHKNTSLADFYVHVPHGDTSVTFRGHQEHTVSGVRVFMLRKTNKDLPELSTSLLLAH